jgi:hypothetical protein
MSADTQVTWGYRLQQFKRREQMTTWFGGGYVALIALAGLLAASITQAVGKILIATMLTTVVIGGACLALTRVGFEWKATEIERRVERREIALTTPVPDNEDKWPAFYEAMWSLAQSLLVVGGFCAMAVGWWWAVAANST